MMLKAPLTMLSLLSLILPTLGNAANIWLFSGKSQTSAPVVSEGPITASPEIAIADFSSKEQKAAYPHQHKKRWNCAVMLGAGYRHDRISQRYTRIGSNPFQRVKFKYHSVGSVVEILRMDARYSNVLFHFEGNYAPVVDGKLTAPFNIDPNIDNVFNFKFKKLSGYEADVMASVGYRLQFMRGCKSRAALIFQLGYRYSHQAYETDAHDRKRTASLVSILQNQAPSHVEWVGPFLEGRFSFSYRDRLYLQPFYQYYFLDYRAQKHQSQLVFNYASGSPPVPVDILAKFISQGDRARGQQGGIDFYYQPKHPPLRVGLKGTYLNFESHDTKTETHIKEILLSTTPLGRIFNRSKYHSHASWRSYTVSTYVGYNF